MGIITGFAASLSLCAGLRCCGCWNRASSLVTNDYIYMYILQPDGDRSASSCIWELISVPCTF